MSNRHRVFAASLLFIQAAGSGALTESEKQIMVLEPFAEEHTADEVARPSDGVVYTGRDAFDIPVLMDNLIAKLLHRPAEGR